MKEISNRWVVTYFAPDGDHRKHLGSEGSARRFAKREDIRIWNPIIEEITTTVEVRVIFNATNQTAN